MNIPVEVLVNAGIIKEISWHDLYDMYPDGTEHGCIDRATDFYLVCSTNHVIAHFKFNRDDSWEILDWNSGHEHRWYMLSSDRPGWRKAADASYPLGKELQK